MISRGQLHEPAPQQNHALHSRVSVLSPPHCCKLTTPTTTSLATKISSRRKKRELALPAHMDQPLPSVPLPSTNSKFKKIRPHPHNPKQGKNGSSGSGIQISGSKPWDPKLVKHNLLTKHERPGWYPQNRTFDEKTPPSTLELKPVFKLCWLLFTALPKAHAHL